MSSRFLRFSYSCDFPILHSKQGLKVLGGSHLLAKMGPRCPMQQALFFRKGSIAPASASSDAHNCFIT
jgi:hypothetical protein